MNKNEKFNKLKEHISWQQVSDIRMLDQECGDRPSQGSSLANQLIENAQNQTGIALDDGERFELVTNLIDLYD